MATKHDQSVKDIVAGLGNPKFTDILNNLWLSGANVADLQKALAQTPNGTNDPTDIVARLLNMKKPDGSFMFTADQIAKSNQVKVPNLPGTAWPFQPDHIQNGVVVPVNQDPVTNWINQDGSPKPNPITIPTTPTNVNIPQTNTPTAAPKSTVTTTVNQPAADAKKPPDTSTEAGIAQFEKDNYGAMLWVNSVPELQKTLHDAAQAQDTPAAFQARLEQTDWWKTHSDTMRQWQTIKADPATYAQRLKENGDNVRALAGSMGVNLSDDQVNQLADQYGQYNWQANPKLLQQAVMNTAQYDPKQGGMLGAEVGKIKALSKSYLLPINDTDAWNYAKQIEAGTLTEDSVTGNFRQMAKSSYPSLADIIDKGGIPAQALAPQINTAASLLEVDPSNIDLTDPKYNKILSFADPKTGTARPMTADETAQFVKTKDEYWTTTNANNEVSSLLNTVGKAFGKVGM